MKTYLNQIINELPTNCLFDKGKVGCGGTSMAIECDKPYVIAVPFVSLVENKLAQYPNERRSEPILGVYAGVGIREIKKYVESVSNPKIVVTYDSLYKIVEAVDPKDFNLLVDEYHILFNHYSFRKDAIKSVLNNYKKFNTFMFMTATPLEEEFILEELKDVPFVSQEWSDITETKVQTVKCDNVEASTIKLINGFLTNQVEGNAYIFVNSVDFIKNLIKKAKLTSENTRVIYSKNNKTKLPISNSTVLDEAKKINLLTSTVFEGSDIYDENGRIIIVSDASKANTLLDISTSIQQIAGRIRNSKYLNWITHLYSTTRYADMTYEDFKNLNLKNIEDSKIAVNAYNSLPEIARKKISGFTSDAYIFTNEDGTFTFDPNMAKIDIFNFKVTRGLYSVRVNLSGEYLKQGFVKVAECEDKSIKIEFTEEKKSFKEYVLEVRREAETMYKIGTPCLDEALLKYPWLKRAIDELGFERIASLQYVQKAIKDELLKVSDNNLVNKVAYKLRNNISLGLFYTNKQLKKMISDAYGLLDIKRTAKATDITHFYNAKPSRKRIDGKIAEGYVIIGYNYIFK